MSKIIKLHGCSGAGKTTVARALMHAATKVHEIIPEVVNGKLNTSQKPEAYVLEMGGDKPLTILGSYRNNCGGMDSYSSNADDIVQLIETFRPDSHVLFEGLLLSTYHGTVGKHLEQYGDDFVCAFLDTPLLTCLERVAQRRAAAGSRNKFNPQLTVDKYNTIERLKNKRIENGRKVVTIATAEDPVVQIRNILWSH